METIPFTDIKRNGLDAIESALKQDTRAIVTVRGQAAYVIMPVIEYDELRTAELLYLAAQARADYAAGRLKTVTAKEHLDHIDALLEAETDAV